MLEQLKVWENVMTMIDGYTLGSNLAKMKYKLSKRTLKLAIFLGETDIGNSEEEINNYLSQFIFASKKQLTEELFDTIKHGDEGHQKWLKEAINKYFAGEPHA